MTSAPGGGAPAWVLRGLLRSDPQDWHLSQEGEASLKKALLTNRGEAKERSWPARESAGAASPVSPRSWQSEGVCSTPVRREPSPKVPLRPGSAMGPVVPPSPAQSSRPLHRVLMGKQLAPSPRQQEEEMQTPAPPSTAPSRAHRNRRPATSRRKSPKWVSAPATTQEPEVLESWGRASSLQDARTAPPEVRKCIEVREDFLQEYELGSQVMPSCHRGMEILFARHKASGQKVVVKVRNKEKSFHCAKEEQSWRETTEVVLNLPAHDGIARLFEVCEDAKAYYVVMEKVLGRDLFEEQSSRGGVLQPSDVKDVLQQVLSALNALHQKGTIHKDIKMENVMFHKQNGFVKTKLIDFDTVEPYNPQEQTRAKDVLGTNQYLAQETYSGLYSPASDIFAAAVIAFRCLTGRYTYNKEVITDKPRENGQGSPKMKEIRQRLVSTPIDWSQKAFAAEPGARDLLRWMLAVNPLQRPSAMEALQHPWLSGKPGPKADRLPTGDMAEHIARPPRQPRTEDILEVTPPSSNPMRPTPRPKTASTVRPSFQANAQANTQAGHGPEELGKVQSAKTKQGAPWKEANAQVGHGPVKLGKTQSAKTKQAAPWKEVQQAKTTDEGKGPGSAWSSDISSGSHDFQAAGPMPLAFGG